MIDITYRSAERHDCALIISFIRELAAYEHMENHVVATEELLAEWLFDKQSAEVIFAVVDNQEVGFALFFTNFSTFLGRAGMYLEDIFIKAEHRRRGIGTAMFKKLAQIAVERGYGRFEWACLDWNTPSIDFYKQHGAVAMDEWTTYRLSDIVLINLAKDGENP